jgi:integrase
MAIYRKQYTVPVPRGAEFFNRGGQRHARWTDRYGRRRTARVTQGRDGTDRLILETNTLLVKFRDAAGVVHEVSSGCRTKTAAEGVQADLRQRTELVRAGVLTQAEDTASRHTGTPAPAHVDAYLEHLALHASPTHVLNVRRQLHRLLTECGFARMADLRGDALERWLGQRRREGMAGRTANTYLAAARAFATWCVEGGRLQADPFIRLRKADEHSDPRHQRRALTEEEVGRLLTVACLRPLAEYGRLPERVTPAPTENKRSNWRRAQLTYDSIRVAAERGRAALAGSPRFIELLERRGRERALIYRTLLLTGLRKGELASITIGQLELDSRPAVLHLAAADEKSRRGTAIPLRDDLAAGIREFLGNRAAIPFKVGRTMRETRMELDTAAPLFEVPNALWRILNRDLAAAGIQKRDARGRVIDVHAMRHTFGTYLCRAGVPLRTAQAAMRHSDPKLTANVYTDPALLDIAGAINSLPRLPAGSVPLAGSGAAGNASDGTNG